MFLLLLDQSGLRLFLVQSVVFQPPKSVRKCQDVRFYGFSQSSRTGPLPAESKRSAERRIAVALDSTKEVVSAVITPIKVGR